MKVHTKPLISIYITTKNRSRLLEKCINSCLNQTYKNTEIIIIDDGSSDNTESICNTYKNRYKKIKILTNKISLGASASRNIGISHARGEYVTGIDDDDQMTPNRIQDFIENFDSKYSLICSTIIHDSPLGRMTSTHDITNIHIEDMKTKNHVGNQIFARKETFLSNSGFDVNMSAWIDYDLWYRIIKNNGAGLKINNHSYIVNQNHQTPRITTSGESNGFKEFIDKHNDTLSNSQKEQLKLRDKLNKNSKISLHDIFTAHKNKDLTLRLLSAYVGQVSPTAIKAIASITNRKVD